MSGQDLPKNHAVQKNTRTNSIEKDEKSRGDEIDEFQKNNGTFYTWILSSH